MGFTEKITDTAISAVSKRLRIAAFVGGLGVVLGVVGLALSFQLWFAFLPLPAILFSCIIALSFIVVTIFGVLDFKKKQTKNIRRHDEEMAMAKFNHDKEMRQLDVQYEQIKLEQMKLKGGE